MLLEFTIGNFLSIKEKKTLSLVPTPISEFSENIAVNAGHKALKSAAIYGANASGKSNFLSGMNTMRYIVENSVQIASTAELPVTPFLLSITTEHAPSFFEVVFSLDGSRFRYGFEATRKQIVNEWLFEAKKATEKPLFLRVPEGIDVANRFKEGRNLESKTRDNALFLSIVDQFNGETAKKILDWFKSFTLIWGHQHDELGIFTLDFLKTAEHNKTLQEILRLFNLGFSSVRVAEKDQTLEGNGIAIGLKKGQLAPRIFTEHQKLDAQNKAIGKVEFNLREQESAGTNKIFDLVGAIFKTLNQGGILAIDELDAQLHPLLTIGIINLFNANDYNPKNAQLIFATHDTTLLSRGNFRRDQVYFTEKNIYEATDLYSLVEYKEEGGKIRKDRSFEKDYIQGRYGAIPFMGDFSKIAMLWQGK